jgi:hypothetical protein
MEKTEKKDRFIAKDYAAGIITYRGDKMDWNSLTDDVKRTASIYGIATVLQRSEAAAEKGSSPDVRKALGLKRWETLASGAWATQEKSSARKELEELKAEAAAQAAMIARQNELLVGALMKMPVKARVQTLAEYTDEERDLIEKIAKDKGIDLTK